MAKIFKFLCCTKAGSAMSSLGLSGLFLYLSHQFELNSFFEIFFYVLFCLTLTYSVGFSIVAIIFAWLINPIKSILEKQEKEKKD